MKVSFASIVCAFLFTYLAALPVKSQTLPFEGCGFITQGVEDECVLLCPLEPGPCYELTDSGGYPVGAYVYVAGVINQCPSICMQGWCLHPNIIQPCGFPRVTLTQAFSRRLHGQSDMYDREISLSGPPLIEPRQNGLSPQIVLTFDDVPRAIDGSIDCGEEIVVTNGLCQGITVADSTITVDMAFGENACVTVQIEGIEDLVGDNDVLVVSHRGDVNGDGNANVIDLQDIKNHMFEPVGASTCAYDVNVDGVINVLDLQEAKNNLFTDVQCQTDSSPQILQYDNSGCKAGALQEDDYPWCGDDQFELAVTDWTLEVTHFNATYNCCPDDLSVTLTVQDNTLRLTEQEVLTTPCACLCCYDVNTSIVNLSPGTYTVEYCWIDDEGGQMCWTGDVTIP